ncbi:MAG: DUF5131 family protein [Oscillospiraceae bacterium]|nr:DUF5131 family protein [Oscillospiraceae bacterium]
MHDIWNPWHGCKKVSEGCDNCYMYFLDRMRDRNGADIYRTKSGFDYPLHKDRHGNYKIKSGELIRVCMTSDFFLEEADEWREAAWEIMRIRSDVKFFLLTKRPERVRGCLPAGINDGFENVFFNVTCENQRRADERIPIMLELPFRHKGVMCAPFIGGIDMEKYLKEGRIEQVICGGENYDGARACNFDWVKTLRKQCEKYNVTFVFSETGTYFIKDGKKYYMPRKSVQREMAYKSGMSYTGRPVRFRLIDSWGEEIPEEYLYTPRYGKSCAKCAGKAACNGCSGCGKCG